MFDVEALDTLALSVFNHLTDLKVEFNMLMRSRDMKESSTWQIPPKIQLLVLFEFITAVYKKKK